jgi:hypothetical protein
VADGANVMFDTFVNNSSPNIIYNALTGVFTINRSGNYYVSWWVNTDFAEEALSVAFSVQVAGGATVTASSPEPLITLQLGGQAMLSIGVAPATLSLVNTSGVNVGFATSAVQADLVILEVTS